MTILLLLIVSIILCGDQEKYTFIYKYTEGQTDRYDTGLLIEPLKQLKVFYTK